MSRRTYRFIRSIVRFIVKSVIFAAIVLALHLPGSLVPGT